MEIQARRSDAATQTRYSSPPSISGSHGQTKARRISSGGGARRPFSPSWPISETHRDIDVVLVRLVPRSPRQAEFTMRLRCGRQSLLPESIPGRKVAPRRKCHGPWSHMHPFTCLLSYEPTRWRSYALTGPPLLYYVSREWLDGSLVTASESPSTYGRESDAIGEELGYGRYQTTGATIYTGLQHSYGNSPC